MEATSGLAGSHLSISAGVSEILIPTGIGFSLFT